MDTNMDSQESSQLRNEGKETSRKMKTVTSFAIFFCTFSFGLAYNFLSPALVELKNKYNTEFEEISKVFTIILLCYLVGALTCGVLFDYLNRQLMVVALLYVMAIGVFVIPYCPTIITFYVIGGMIGFTAGGYDTAQIVWVLEMWQGEAGRYVQAQYFFFALGNLVAPLLMMPYLQTEDILKETKCNPIETTTIMTTSTTESSGNHTVAESQLYIPISIGGSVIMMASSVILILFFYDKYVPPIKKVVDTIATGQVQDVDNHNQIHVEDSEPPKKRWNWNKIILVALSATVLGCYQGMEISTFQFMPAYSHYVDLKLSEPEGASVLSALTGAFTAGRLLGIIIVVVLKTSPSLILIANLLISVGGNVILLIFSNSNETLLWVGAALLGLGYSTVFACVYDHIEKHLKITNKIAATMVIAGGLVSALYPLIVGEFIECHPHVLNFTIFFSIVSCTISFSFIYWITVIKKRHQSPNL